MISTFFCCSNTGGRGLYDFAVGLYTSDSSLLDRMPFLQRVFVALLLSSCKFDSATDASFLVEQDVFDSEVPW